MIEFLSLQTLGQCMMSLCVERRQKSPGDPERLDERCPMLLWIARVPSSSNPADPPSRKSLRELEFLRPFKIIDARCPIQQCTLRSYEM